MAWGLANASNMKNLRKEVQRVFSVTSDRCVPEPYQKAVQADIWIAIRRFKNVVRWKEFWRDQKQSTETEVNEVIEENSRFMTTGLNTGLKPTFGINTEKYGSDNLEGFLTAVEKPLLKEDFKRGRFERPNRKTSETYDVLQGLKKSGFVYFPTDKTNSTRVIKI